LLADGQDLKAEEPLANALTIVEKYLSNLQSESARLSWSRLQGTLYRDVLSIRLRSSTPAEALASWEWYRGAALRSVKKADLRKRAQFKVPAITKFSLPYGTALVSYVLLPNQIAAFVVRGGGVRVRFLPSPATLSPLALRFVRHCMNPKFDSATLGEDSARLYSLLVFPLEADLLGITTLNIETDGVLDRLPFDLLRTSNGRYLGDRFDLILTPGMAYAFPTDQEELSIQDRTLVVVGNSQGTSLDPIPETTQEGDDVASYLPNVTVVSGVHVTHANVMHELKRADWLHFAGHAITTPGNVGLVLGPDSILDARDVATLSLRNLHLAVLSGCGTANGEDGTYTSIDSLARTFIAAGTHYVVASRWPVDSNATRLLMSTFYAGLLSGQPISTSLHKAAIALRNTAGYEHPYYWSSFAVFGR
jgi:hypothetical protein